MLRRLWIGLLPGAFLLVLAGCGRSAAAPTGEAAPSAGADLPAAASSVPQPGAATSAPVPQSELARTERLATSPEAAAPASPATKEPSAAANSPDAAGPTAAALPGSASTATAGPAAHPAAPTEASGTGDLLTLRGVIKSVDGKSVTLNVSAERILLTADTKVLALTKPVPLSSLAVGRDVFVQATRDAQGQLVAKSIAIEPTVLRRAKPPAR